MREYNFFETKDSWKLTHYNWVNRVFLRSKGILMFFLWVENPPNTHTMIESLYIGQSQE